MKGRWSGQAAVQAIILNGLIVAGVFGIWAVCHQRINDYIKALLKIVASPLP